MKEKDEDLYDLSEDLRLQLVVLELEDKINKYIYDTHKESMKKKYRIIRIAKGIIIFLYTILVFFEKPIFCYNSTTFYNRENKEDNKCPPDLAYLNEKLFINEFLYRYIEIVFLISFVFMKILHFKLKKIDIFKKINLYNIIQYIIFLLILLCLIDIILSLILDYYPLINFFCRGILIILLIKSQRKMWEILFKIFYHTRVLTFLIFCVMLFFGIVGFYLFGNKSDDFSTVCGISQSELKERFVPEIKEMAQNNDMTEEQCLSELKKNYDGYHFSPDTREDIYNPFSLMNAFFNKSFGSYLKWSK